MDRDQTSSQDSLTQNCSWKNKSCGNLAVQTIHIKVYNARKFIQGWAKQKNDH